jgi:hypothetical protein
MFPFSIHSLISCVLMAATLLGGIVPLVQAGSHCGIETCCCLPSIEAEYSCCSQPSHQLQCQCLVEKDLPAAPDENRRSHERESSRRAAALVVTYAVCMKQSKADATFDTLPFSFWPILRQQEILCRWLI